MDHDLLRETAACSQNPRLNYNQQWSVVTSGVHGWPMFINRNTRKQLTIQSESMEDGATLVQYTPPS